MDPKAGVLENCLLDHLEQGNSGFGYQMVISLFGDPGREGLYLLQLQL